MLQLKFFASLRDQLDTSEESLVWEPRHASVAKLKQVLSERGERWEQLLSANNVLVAINQDMAFEHSVISDGDEVAFFPPVTGG